MVTKSSLRLGAGRAKPLLPKGAERSPQTLCFFPPFWEYTFPGRAKRAPKDRLRGGRGSLTGPALASMAVALAGCGFTPMYAHPGVASGMTAIDVVVPHGRVAYLLREDLDDAFGHDKGAPAVWRLDLTFDQSRIPLGLTENDVAERYALGLKVHYSLTEIATGRVAIVGDAASEVSYDSANQPYSGIAARQDTQQRAAGDVARRIQVAVGQWRAQQEK